MKKIIIGVLIGFILGFSSGTLFYSKLLDKPEVVNQNKIKQKVKGTGNEVSTEYQNNQIIESKTKNRREKRNEGESQKIF